MRIIKRTAWGFGAVAVLIVGGAVALLLVVGGAGQSAIEAWVGDQLKEVAAAHLKPELEFDTIDYQAPRTLVLTNVRLTADDPDHPDQRIDIIDAKRIRIELAELPSEGEPLRIKSIELDGATIRLIDTDQSGLVGFSDFVREKSTTDAPPLSEVLQITQISITGGAIEYDARTSGTEPMRFDQIDTVLDIDETDGGTYALDLKLDRKDELDLRLKGGCDLDAMRLAVESLKGELDLSRDKDHYLPPQVQAFMKQYDLVGRLALDASGELDFNDVAASPCKITLQLTDAHGSIAGYRLPINKLTIDAQMADRVVTIDRLVSDLLGGELYGEGKMRIGDGDGLPATLQLSGNGLQLRELMVQGTEGNGVESAAVAGRVDLQLNVEAPLEDVLNQMTGAGEVRISEGRIARLPLISGLIDFMESAGNISRRSDAPTGRDEGRAVFELRGDHAYLSKLQIEGTWFAMQGKGKVYFDNRVAMNINAGPLEKVLSSIGPLGSVLNEVKNGMIAYGVRGPFGDLTIRPIPLGGLLGAPGEDD